MSPTLDHQIRDLAVPLAALAFGGCALALFTWPVHTPPQNRSPAVGAPVAFANVNPRREIRQIPITQPIQAVSLTPEADVVLPAIRPVASAPAVMQDRPPAKPAIASPVRAASSRRPVDTRPVRGERVAARGPGKSTSRSAEADEDRGFVARTLSVGYNAAGVVAGGVKGARDTAFGLGRTVSSLVEDIL